VKCSEAAKRYRSSYIGEVSPNVTWSSWWEI